MSEKEYFLSAWDREFQTTVRVLNAYPTESMDLRPSEKSRTARELAWQFVSEEHMYGQIYNGKIEFGPSPAPPETMQEIVSAYESNHKEKLALFGSMTEEDYNGPIQFPVGPKQMGDFRKIDLCWMMINDMIHHRGQFSVYLRIAGGKLPPIYGPTADYPWN